MVSPLLLCCIVSSIYFIHSGLSTTSVLTRPKSMSLAIHAACRTPLPDCLTGIPPTYIPQVTASSSTGSVILHLSLELLTWDSFNSHLALVCMQSHSRSIFPTMCSHRHASRNPPLSICLSLPYIRPSSFPSFCTAITS